ncbi:MAG: S1 RNA-binding domain-containing protein, partial [Kiritimatiellae bacterium]|nr:S1 RNA-binding domain-containing protein [Kiritimatiellia bacterium]
VHQDGLVHVSELSDNFVTDPASVVKAGDRLKVTVIGVDRARGRISLSAKTHPTAGAGAISAAGAVAGASRARGPSRRTSFAPSSGSGFSCNPFASL